MDYVEPADYIDLEDFRVDSLGALQRLKFHLQHIQENPMHGGDFGIAESIAELQRMEDRLKFVFSPQLKGFIEGFADEDAAIPDLSESPSH